jgi:ABC-type transport system substrate-binding protein
MKPWLPSAALFLGAALLWGGVRPAYSAADPGQAGGASQERLGPGPEPVDRWHPQRAEPAAPAFGGTLRIHTEALPSSLNGMLLNSQYARNMHFELHASLLGRDWESWEFVPELATAFEIADTVVMRDGRTRYGRCSEQEGKLLFAETIPPAGTEQPEVLEQAACEKIERGTVLTFHLRPDVRWHDGHPFDAEDVRFTWSIGANPAVNCGWTRPYLQKFVRVEALDRHTVRFFMGEQYFYAFQFLNDHFCILPRHLYDLADPDHALHDPDASDEARAKAINENPHNTEWVGLGPYRLAKYSAMGVEAERFPGYWDLGDSGYADRIVWRHIANDEAAFQALLNGELDFTQRISSEQYFGAAMAQEAFTRNHCKGYFYLGAFNYVPWNLRRAKLSDVRVRKAMALAFDMEGFVETIAHGLAVRPTGSQCYFGPAYDHEVEPLPYDPSRAKGLFAEAGWFDRDGDGVLDKDGEPFEIEMLILSGNASAELFGRMLQESLAKVGARLVLTPVDSATYTRRINERDFDCGQAGWSLDAIENDPMQLWHSRSAVAGGSNHPGVVDPFVDELITRGGRELDPEKRHALWRELQRYLYEEVQPYFYREAPARKFALSKALRGVQFFKIAPGYSLRRWYFPSGTPGTRPTR